MLAHVLPLLLLAGCGTGLPRTAARSEPGSGGEEPRLVLEVAHSPNGLASLVYFRQEQPEELDRVVLVRGRDTIDVLDWSIDRQVSMEWITDDLGQVHVPVGGVWHHTGVYVEASTGRVSPMLDTPAAVDGASRTVATYDVHAFKLRDLWTGRELASWEPTDPDAMTLWQECGPTITLAGRVGRIRYDCGRGPVERAIPW